VEVNKALVELEASIPPPPPPPGAIRERCQSVGDFTIWGRPARGMDLRNYTGNTLSFIGISTDGGTPSNFFCTYDATADRLSFGTNQYVALHTWALKKREVGPVC
jgi:hypothetical protein